MPLLASGKSREPTPRQFLIGASPFSIESATAAVVPRCVHSWRIAAVGDCILLPIRVIKRYSQPSQLLGLAKYANSRATNPRSRLYSSVMLLQSAFHSAGLATLSSPVPDTTIAFRFLLP